MSVKGVVCDSNPKHFLSNSEKQSGVHTLPWHYKWETNRVARVEPPTQDIKY